MANNEYNNSNSVDLQKQERVAEAAFKENQAKVAETIKVKDGKLFGLFPVAKEMERTINMFLAPATAALGQYASAFIYKQTKGITSGSFFEKKLPSIAKNSSKIAMYAELGSMWGILALRPIMEFVAANRDFTVSRMDLGKQVRSVCESTGADYANNEVIKAAYADLNNEWVDDLKMMIPGLMVFATQAPLGLKLQNKIFDQRKNEFALTESTAAIKAANPNKTAAEAAAEAKSKMLKAEAEAHKSASAAFFDANPELKGTEAGNRQFEKFMERSGTTPQTPKTQEQQQVTANNDLMTWGGISTAMGMLGPDIAESMRKKRASQGNKHTSFDLIMGLQENAQGGLRVEKIHAAVIEIFQQLEDDMKRPKFAGVLLDTLKESTLPIAEAIAEGRLNALALVKLAGENKVIEHTNGKRSFHDAEEVEKIVNEMIGSQVHKDKEISAEQFLETFENPTLAKETIKKTLAELKGDERNFFISIMPIEILEQAGLGVAEIRECRTCAHKQLYDQIGSGMIHLAAQDDEFLKKHGLSEKQIRGVKELSRHIENGDMKTLEKMVDSHDPIIAAFASAELNEQIAKGDTKVWSELVEAKPLQERIAEIKAEKEEKPHVARHEDKRHDGHVDRHQKAAATKPDHSLGA